MLSNEVTIRNVNFYWLLDHVIIFPSQILDWKFQFGTLQSLLLLIASSTEFPCVNFSDEKKLKYSQFTEFAHEGILTTEISWILCFLAEICVVEKITEDSIAQKSNQEARFRINVFTPHRPNVFMEFSERTLNLPRCSLSLSRCCCLVNFLIFFSRF